MVAALPEEHPLATRSVVPVSALADERLLLFSRHFHPGCYDYIVGCCQEAGFEPDVVQRRDPQLYSGATTYRMVASGLGISIVACPLVLDARASGVVFRPLEDPKPMLDLVVAWRRNDLSANPAAFLEVAREFAPAEIRADSLAGPPSAEGAIPDPEATSG
jgi:DNA-binding transcriptional LysR family regulator